MAPLIGLIVFQAIASAILCAVVASAKRRDPLVWGLAGLAFGLLSLIAVSGMPIASRSRKASPGAVTTASVIQDARERLRQKEAEKLRRWEQGGARP